MYEDKVMKNRHAQKQKRVIHRLDQIEKQIDEAGKFNRDLWGALNVELWFQKFMD